MPKKCHTILSREGNVNVAFSPPLVIKMHYKICLPVYLSEKG